MIVRVCGDLVHVGTLMGMEFSFRQIMQHDKI